MEMKEDFLKPPERIFHKIYIQRHDNVRYGAVMTAVELRGVLLEHCWLISTQVFSPPQLCYFAVTVFKNI